MHLVCDWLELHFFGFEWLVAPVVCAYRSRSLICLQRCILLWSGYGAERLDECDHLWVIPSPFTQCLPTDHLGFASYFRSLCTVFNLVPEVLTVKSKSSIWKTGGSKLFKCAFMSLSQILEEVLVPTILCYTWATPLTFHVWMLLVTDVDCGQFEGNRWDRFPDIAF